MWNNYPVEPLSIHKYLISMDKKGKKYHYILTNGWNTVCYILITLGNNQFMFDEFKYILTG